MDIPSLAFNLKSYSNEAVIIKSFKKPKEQSQKESSINLLYDKLNRYSSTFNLNPNFAKNAADEMKKLPTIKVMNMSYLAGALIFLNSVNDEPTPQNFKTPYTDKILRTIYSSDEDEKFTTSQYEELFNYIFSIYVFRLNHEIESLKLQIYEYYSNKPPQNVIDYIESLDRKGLIDYRNQILQNVNI